jgi:O-acetylserine/cysteine efflux transporter
VPHTSFTRRDLAAALCVVLIWGTNFIAMKYALRELTPFQLGIGRYVFAALPLVLLVRPPAMPWRWVALYGLCQGVGQFGLLFLSLKIGMSAALASVVLQTQVFFTALLAVVLLGEKVSRTLKSALVLAAIGLACFAANYLAPGGAAAGTSAAGLLLCVAAAAMWASSNIVVRRAQRSTPRFDVVPFMVWSSLVPIVPFVLLSLAFDAPAAQSVWLRASMTTWVSIALLGWFATIVAYALWTGLLKRHPANRVAPFSLAVPLIGVSTGMLVLGDTITGWQWAGIAFIGASLVMVVFGARLMRQAQA